MRNEIISLSIILMLLISPIALAAPGEANGTVTYVVDGDTIYVQIQGYDTRIGNITVRLADIDSPEMNTDKGPSCKQFAQLQLNGSSVTLDLDDKKGKDGSGRWVAVLYRKEQDGTLVNFNKMIVDSGYACICDYLNNEFDPLAWWIDTDFAEACRLEMPHNRRINCTDVQCSNNRCSDGPVVGNEASGKYHYPYCRHAMEMDLSNVIWFISSENARGQGYVPCEVCSPPA